MPNSNYTEEAALPKKKGHPITSLLKSNKYEEHYFNFK